MLSLALAHVILHQMKSFSQTVSVTVITMQTLEADQSERCELRVRINGERVGIRESTAELTTKKGRKNKNNALGHQSSLLPYRELAMWLVEGAEQGQSNHKNAKYRDELLLEVLYGYK